MEHKEPLPQPTKEAEQRAKELYPYNNDKNDHVTDLMNEQLRKAYLRGHSEASTEQAGQLKILREALESVREILKEIDTRGYRNNFAKHYETIDKALSTQFHTGQAGEVKLLRDALKAIEFNSLLSINTILTNKDLDPVKALDAIHGLAKQALSSTPSHTVEDDWVRVRKSLQEAETHLTIPLEPSIALYHVREAMKLIESPTPTTDKVEEQLREHAATWEEAVAHTKEDNSAMSKTAYLEQLENKLRQ